MALNTAEEFISLARVKLLAKFPFFGHLALGLRIIEAPHIPTMAVNKFNHLLFNREFVMSLSPEDVMAIVCHEVGHLVQMCINRFPQGGIFEIWNLASDQVINTILSDAGIVGGTVFQSVNTKEVQDKCRNKLTEVRYRELLKEMKITNCPACSEMIRTQGQSKGDNNGEGEGSSAGDGESDGSPGESEGGNCDSHNHGKGGDSNGGGGGKLKHTCKNPLQCSSGSMLGKADAGEVSEVTQRVIGAYHIAKERESRNGRGSMPGNLEEMILRLLKPSINWRDILSRTAKKVFRGGMDWRRQSKRMVASGVRYPGRKPEMKGAVGAIDTSGSIGDKDIAQFMGECQGILHSAGCKYMLILFHDVYVYHMELYTTDTMNKLKVQRGGTSHEDVFQKISELKDQPSMIICFTDLQTCFPKEKPKIPVIWAHIGECSIEPPFGKKIEVKFSQ